MKARLTTLALTLLFALGLSLPGGVGAASQIQAPGPVGGEYHGYFNFERDLGPWEASTDSIYHKVALVQRSGASACPDLIGNHYAQLLSIPMPTGLAPTMLYKPGTWTKAAFPIAGGGHRLVTLQWSARWSAEPTAAMMPTAGMPWAYAGTTAPTKAFQFTMVPAKLSYEWQTFTYQTDVVLGPTDTDPIDARPVVPVYIALGWNDTSDLLDIDCLNVAITYWPTTR